MSKLIELRRTFARWTMALFCAFSVAGTAVRADDRPVVMTVNYALSYFAERLGGDDIEVVFPVPDDVDPAFWRPGIADISTLQQADLIVLNGASFASWPSTASLPRAKTLVATRGLEAQFIATESVTHSHGDGGEHSHTGTASFTWLDPALARMQVATLAAALNRRGLVAPEDIANRLAELTRDLNALEAAGAALKDGDVHLIATHPRYQYLARAFGLEIDALDWEAGAAPDASQLDALAEMASETGAAVLIWEAAPPDTAREAVRALGMTDLVFPTLATRPVSGDYLSAFQAGLEDLAKAMVAADG